MLSTTEVAAEASCLAEAIEAPDSCRPFTMAAHSLLRLAALLAAVAALQPAR